MVDIINNKEEIVNNKIELLFHIAEVVTGINEEELKSKLRARPRVIVRSIVGYILHMELGLSVVQAGSVINRDHSTVVYYCKVHKDNFDWYKRYRDTYTKISETFWGNYIAAEKQDIKRQVASLERLINRLQRKQRALLKADY